MILHCKISVLGKRDDPMAPRHERTIEIAHKVAAEAVLAASLPTVTCLTGFAADIQTGPNPFVMPSLELSRPSFLR